MHTKLIPHEYSQIHTQIRTLIYSYEQIETQINIYTFTDIFKYTLSYTYIHTIIHTFTMTKSTHSHLPKYLQNPMYI